MSWHYLHGWAVGQHKGSKDTHRLALTLPSIRSVW